MSQKLRLKLVQDFDELVKPYKHANEQNKDTAGLYQKAKEKCINLYNHEMKKIVKAEIMDEDKLRDHHQKTMKIACGTFESKRIPNEHKLYKHYKNELYEKLIACYLKFRKANNSNILEEKHFYSFRKEQHLMECVDYVDDYIFKQKKENGVLLKVRFEESIFDFTLTATCLKFKLRKSLNIKAKTLSNALSPLASILSAIDLI